MLNEEKKFTGTIGNIGTSSFYPPHHVTMGEGFRIVGTLENTDRIMRDTFWIGIYPGTTNEMIYYMAKVIIEAVKHYFFERSCYVKNNIFRIT